MKKFAVVLGGCGVFDGAEIHEATLSLLAIKQQGAAYEIFAPDIQQHHVINHLTGEVMPESRNVLVESARIARGKIRNLTEFRSSDFDALLFPGGFGVAKNFCDFAFRGSECKIEPGIQYVINEMVKAGKPVGALCIAPVMLARMFSNAILTIGQDKGTADDIVKMGAQHETSSHGQVTIDTQYKFYTSPCYMLDADITDIYEGACNVVKATLSDI